LLPFLVVLALWVWAFVDCVTTPEHEVRYLPKVLWVIIILLFGEVLVGPLAWLIAGRRRGVLATRPQDGPADPFGAGPGRPRVRPLAPDDDPEFLASLGRDNQQREQQLREWEADLRRRERELREKGENPED
jgi:hypothetical protein